MHGSLLISHRSRYAQDRTARHRSGGARRSVRRRQQETARRDFGRTEWRRGDRRRPDYGQDQQCTGKADQHPRSVRERWPADGRCRIFDIDILIVCLGLLQGDRVPVMMWRLESRGLGRNIQLVPSFGQMKVQAQDSGDRESQSEHENRGSSPGHATILAYPPAENPPSGASVR